MTAPGSDGTGRAWVDSTTAPTLPVVVDASHEQFEFDEDEYVVPHGTYATLEALANALNGALTGGTDRFDLVIVVSVSQASGLPPTKLRFTAVDSGANTKAFGAGATNDLAASLVLADTTPLANGFTAGTPTTYESDLTDDQVPPEADAPIAGNPLEVVTVDTGLDLTDGVLTNVGVLEVDAGEGISVDSTDPTAPVVSVT